MAGAWEIKAQNRVLGCVLHTELTSIAWAYGFRNLICPGPIIPYCGAPFDDLRNRACQDTLNGGYEYLFCYDSDVIPPRDAILRLMSRNLPFVSGLYNRRSLPWSIPVAIKNGTWLTQFQPGSIVEVDLVGAGCLLIHRSVLENLPPQRPGHHWFDWRVCYQNEASWNKEQLPCLSEDFTLCEWFRRHGGRVFLDTSVQCKHVGLAESEYMSFKPCSITVNT